MRFKKACATKLLTERGWQLYDRSNYYKIFRVKDQKYRVDLQFSYRPVLGYTELKGIIYSKELKYVKNIYNPVLKGDIPKNVLKKVFRDIELLKKNCEIK